MTTSSSILATDGLKISGKKAWGGVALKHRLNGWEASVICHDFSLGSSAGLWEIWMFQPPRLGEKLGAPCTADPVGWLTPFVLLKLLKDFQKFAGKPLDNWQTEA